MTQFCFFKEIGISHIDKIKKLINETTQNLRKDVKSIIIETTSKQLNSQFRSYREIDNFIENYIAINYSLQKIQETNPEVLNKQINFIGATYGGLELPFIANEILEGEIATTAIILQSKYKDRKAEEYLSSALNLQNIESSKDAFNIIGDDNVLTGKTLQSMINLLFTNEIPVDKIAIVRYPSINRVEQMIYENSAIDTTKFFDYIQGLVFSSPYTRIKSNTEEKYLDELGIFNKDRRRLLEYIYKNGRFSENSEVNKIGEMYNERN